jgi:ribosomal protein S18 acetylase RimI-like enzyme
MTFDGMLGAEAVTIVQGSAEERALSEGFERAQLWVRVDDARASTLYRHRGFENTDDDKMHAHERIVRLEKQLRRLGKEP